MKPVPRIIHCIWIGGGDIAQGKDTKAIKSWLKYGFKVWIWWDSSHTYSMHGVRNAISSGVGGEQLRKLYESEVDPPESSALGQTGKPQKSALGKDIRNLRMMTFIVRHREVVTAQADLIKIRQEYLESHLSRTDFLKQASGPAKQKLTLSWILDDYDAFRQDKSEFLKSQTKTSAEYEKLALVWFLDNRSKEAFRSIRKLKDDNKDRVTLCNIRDHKFIPGAPGSTMQWLNKDLLDMEMAFRGIFPAAASDILRYEILYNFGGIYMDVDLELTSAVPDSKLEVEANLALCAPLDSQVEREDASQPYQKATEETHSGMCFYASNGILAVHPRSKFVDHLREAIKLAYSLLGLPFGKPKNLILKHYWLKLVNKATIDLTGPNLVREIQYQLFLQDSKPPRWKPDEIPAHAVDRLIIALGKHTDLWLTPQKPEGVDTNAALKNDNYPRFAKLWEDNDPRYYKFWNWVFSNTYFPMEYVNWNTDAAKKSDTKAAGKQ